MEGESVEWLTSLGKRVDREIGFVAGTTPSSIYMSENNTTKQSYEIALKIVGNEIFSLRISTDSESNRWVAITITTILLFAGMIVLFGDAFIDFFKMLSGS